MIEKKSILPNEFIKESIAITMSRCFVPRPEKLNQYIFESRHIAGWFNPLFLNILLILNHVQHENEIGGGVAEIGIFHGKSFIPMFLLCDKDEYGLAIDHFEYFNEELKVSMLDKYTTFLRHLTVYDGGDMPELKIMKADTRQLASKEISKTIEHKKIRLFSVDGGHQVDQAEVDIKHACYCLQDGGVVIVDDFFLYDWPGVTEAVFRILNSEKYDLCPFFLGYNKLLLTQKRFAKKYQESIKQFWGDPSTGFRKLMNHHILIYG